MRARKGFTVLELMMVVVAISVLAAVVIPAFFHDANVTLENAAVLLARDLRAAQNRSAYMAEPSTFVFHADGDGYEVQNPDGELILNPRTGHEFVRHYSIDGVFRGVRIEQVDAGGDRRIEFDDLGLALETAQITLTFEGVRRVVVLEEGNGRLTIRGSPNGWRE